MPSLCLKNGKKRWRGAVMVAGRSVRRWFQDASKDSERAAAAWEAEQKKLLSQAPATPTATVSWTLLDWVNQALDNAQSKRAPATYKEKKSTFSFLILALGPTFPLNELDVDIAEEHLDKQAEDRSGNAANKDRKNLAAEWKWAKRRFRKNGFPQGENPWIETGRYAETRHPRYVPPMADFKAVLSAANGQDHAMLTVLLHLAARKDEVFRLCWTDVDFKRSRVRLRTRKTENGEWREDWLPMTQECRKALMRQWENRIPDQDAVFVQEGIYNLGRPHGGRPFTSRQHVMRKLCTRAKVAAFGFHAIRHLAAGALFEAGYPVATIQKVLRHQNPTTTTVYLRNHGYDVDCLETALECALGKNPGKVLLMKNAPETGISEAFCPQGLPPGNTAKL